MHANFDDPDRAASYIAEGVQHDFAEEQFVITWCDQRHNRAGRIVCDRSQLLGELFKLCRQFPGASVDYTPEHPSGIIGKIISAEHRYHAPHSSNHHHNHHLQLTPYSSLKDGRYVIVQIHRPSEDKITRAADPMSQSQSSPPPQYFAK
ncbi:MAG TPA: hypothetical protein PLO62_06110 [Candidatus Hydrogenedentes bacterium]|nr:hypothetical protein [Candidatus Hydrogenedentota bacterium]